jgi:hypothetical protein
MKAALSGVVSYGANRNRIHRVEAHHTLLRYGVQTRNVTEPFHSNPRSTSRQTIAQDSDADV